MDGIPMFVGIVHGNRPYYRDCKIEEVDADTKRKYVSHTIWRLCEDDMFICGYQNQLKTFFRNHMSMVMLKWHHHPVAPFRSQRPMDEMNRMIKEWIQWRKALVAFIQTRCGHTLMGAVALYPICHMLRELDIGLNPIAKTEPVIFTQYDGRSYISSNKPINDD
jgi:hypothetical protein